MKLNYELSNIDNNPRFKEKMRAFIIYTTFTRNYKEINRR